MFSAALLFWHMQPCEGLWLESRKGARQREQEEVGNLSALCMAASILKREPPDVGWGGEDTASLLGWTVSPPW